MKKLDVSSVTNSAQMKLKSGTLQFLQDANAEALAAICQGLIGSAYSASQVYILWGCVNSGSGTSYVISAGAVFYAGEIYLVDAATFTLSGNVAIFSPITTQYQVNADPMTFSDSSVHNIHNIRKMRIIGGTTGTIDYLAAKGILEFVPAQLNLTGTGMAVVTGTYPNKNVYVPENTYRYPALYAGKLNIGDVAGGGVDYAITFPQALANNSYYVVGTIVSNPTSTSPSDDTSLFWTVRGRTSSGFVLHILEFGNWTQDISFEYIIFAV